MYRLGQKVSPVIFGSASQFSYFWHIYYRKLATGKHIVSPPNVVYVTALPCEILKTTFSTLNVIQPGKKVVFTSVVIIGIGQTIKSLDVRACTYVRVCAYVFL